MAFIRTETGNLINLDHVVKLNTDREWKVKSADLSNGDHVAVKGCDRDVEFATARIIPAAPGSELLGPLVDDNKKIVGGWRRPVIAWALRDDEHPHAICVDTMPCLRRDDEYGLRYPDGQVETNDGTYENEDDWLNGLKAQREELQAAE